MILDKIIKMKWNSYNKKYYENKGYIYTKMFEMFDLKIEDLNKNSSYYIKCKCENCETELNVRYVDYIKSTKNLSESYYCTHCKYIKYKQTCIEKYGVENVSMNKDIKQKRRETNLKRYGVENLFQSNEILQKIKNTNLDRYGVEYPFQSNIIQEKAKETFKNKYNVDNPSKNIDIINKIKSVFMEKYGVENPMFLEEFREKIIQTQIDKYGEIYAYYIPKYNPLSIIIFDEISEKLNINIQHALDGGEKKFQRYWVDGYIESKNIVIEWDEKYHNKIKDKDIIRQKWIEDNFKCKFIRIVQEEYLHNKDVVINDILVKINKLITS
jgi:hypothetical protein